MSDKEENPDNRDIYVLLGEIKAEVKGLREQQSKTILALIALVGAVLGLKVLGTHPLILISRFVNIFVFLFAAGLAISKRKSLEKWEYVFFFGYFC